MISSPCKNCPFREKGKNDCIKDCSIIKAVQEIERDAQLSHTLPGIDCSDESRYFLPQPSLKVWSL